MTKYSDVDYYNIAGMEAIDVIEILEMTFSEGSAFKYLYRCNSILPKGEVIKDLNKTIYYLERCLARRARFIKTNRAKYCLEQINPQVFDEDIYAAIFEIIEGVGASEVDYETSLRSALEIIRNVIKRY